MSKRRISAGPYIVPMPVVLVGALVDGKANFMTAAFCTIVNTQPAVIACGLNPTHCTSRGIEAQGCFSINLPSRDQVEITDYCGLNSGDSVDKSDIFRTFQGDLPAPLIEECSLNAECRLIATHRLPVDTVYLAEIVAVHADDRVLTEGKLDWRKVQPLLFTFPDAMYWQLGESAGKAWSVGKKFQRD